MLEARTHCHNSMILRRVGLDAQRDRVACPGNARRGDQMGDCAAPRSQAGRDKGDRAGDGAKCGWVAVLRQ